MEVYYQDILGQLQSRVSNLLCSVQLGNNKLEVVEQCQEILQFIISASKSGPDRSGRAWVKPATGAELEKPISRSARYSHSTIGNRKAAPDQTEGAVASNNTLNADFERVPGTGRPRSFNSQSSTGIPEVFAAGTNNPEELPVSGKKQRPKTPLYMEPSPFLDDNVSVNSPIPPVVVKLDVREALLPAGASNENSSEASSEVDDLDKPKLSVSIGFIGQASASMQRPRKSMLEKADRVRRPNSMSQGANVKVFTNNLTYKTVQLLPYHTKHDLLDLALRAFGFSEENTNNYTLSFWSNHTQNVEIRDRPLDMWCKVDQQTTKFHLHRKRPANAKLWPKQRGPSMENWIPSSRKTSVTRPKPNYLKPNLSVEGSPQLRATPKLKEVLNSRELSKDHVAMPPLPPAPLAGPPTGNPALTSSTASNPTLPLVARANTTHRPVKNMSFLSKATVLIPASYSSSAQESPRPDRSASPAPDGDDGQPSHTIKSQPSSSKLVVKHGIARKPTELNIGVTQKGEKAEKTEKEKVEKPEKSEKGTHTKAEKSLDKGSEKGDNKDKKKFLKKSSANNFKLKKIPQKTDKETTG